ncbi:MAG: rhodanese-like domain-containing protein, partial [Chloroflexi bacterium]|nr:rhodanese-like domain-containing protein [Chloroflexota bacterium]
MAEGYARPELLADVPWLASQLDDPNVRVVDCRYYFDGRDGRAVYDAGHIPGAVHVNWSQELADTTATPPNLAP